MKILIDNKLVLKIFFIGSIAIWINFNVNGQDLDQQDTSLVFQQGIFDSDKLMHCSLTFNIREFRNNKFEAKKIPAVFSHHKSDSIAVHKNISIKARGNSRKKICYFPPIKLKLKKASFDDPYFDLVKNQKLVTHCKVGKNYEQGLLKEYLAYKLYNILTEKSFRVRLIDMTYMDSENKVKTSNHYAFIIEDIDVLADRNNGLKIKQERLDMSHVDTSSMLQISLFQYMIGNVDWSIAGLHNIKLIQSKDFSQGLPYAVPYDFDFSGFVDAGYATNVLDPEITSVKIRMFVGVCYAEDHYLKIIRKFINNKSEIYAMINNFELLNTGSRKELLSYIDKFYKQIEQPNFYKRYIVPYCKKYDN